MWHGANWTFVCWGLYHACLLSIYNILGINTKYKEVVAFGHFFPNIKEILQMSLTFCLAVFGWIIFRAESLEQVLGYFGHMVTNPLIDGSHITGEGYIFYSLVMLLIEWLQRSKQHALQFNLNSFVYRYSVVRYLFWIFMLFLLFTLKGSDSEFIYFQF